MNERYVVRFACSPCPSVAVELVIETKRGLALRAVCESARDVQRLPPVWGRWEAAQSIFTRQSRLRDYTVITSHQPVTESRVPGGSIEVVRGALGS